MDWSTIDDAAVLKANLAQLKVARQWAKEEKKKADPLTIGLGAAGAVGLGAAMRYLKERQFQNELASMRQFSQTAAAAAQRRKDAEFASRRAQWENQYPPTVETENLEVPTNE